MLTALVAVTLTTTETQSGYTSEATNGGPDAEGLLASAITDLQAASTKLTELVAVLPTGSNKTAINTALTTLNA